MSQSGEQGWSTERQYITNHDILTLPSFVPAQQEDEPVPSGYGSSIWNKLAAVAGALTINVSERWAGTEDGEGQSPLHRISGICLMAIQ